MCGLVAAEAGAWWEPRTTPRPLTVVKIIKTVAGGGVASTPMISCTVAILARAILLIRCRMP